MCVSVLDGNWAFSRGAVELGMLLGSEVARALEREQAAEQQKELEHNLMRQDKLATIGEMASGLAHEINNPLAFVSGNLSVLESYVEDLAAQPGPGGESEELVSEINQCLAETNQGVERVLRIIADLKNMARRDGNSKEIADINELIEGAVRIVWNQIKYRVEVVREYSELPPVSCHPSQLGQVFLNLIHNAGQAIEDKGQIVLRTQAEEGRVVIEVQDDGKGMEPETSRRIFEPFYTTKPRGVGTGLGLSISSKIVARHNGTIDLASRPGHGSTFRVTIPIESD
jgi:signal transduction histidine kinase